MKPMLEQNLPVLRKALKDAFPKGYKFSVTVKNYDALTIALMKGDFDIEAENGYQQLNRYFLDRLENQKLREVFETVDQIRAKIIPCEDRSDIMTDYFDVDYYIQYNVGKWDQPYINFLK